MKQAGGVFYKYYCCKLMYEYSNSHTFIPVNTKNYNKYSYVLNNPLKYTDPSGNLSQRVYKLHPPDMDGVNHQLQMDREAQWAIASGQGDGDEFGAFMGLLVSSGGGGWGGAPSSGDAVGGDGGGDVVAQKNGTYFQIAYLPADGMGLRGSFGVSYSISIRQVKDWFVLSVRASAWAPIVESEFDGVVYVGSIDVYDENGEKVYSEKLQKNLFSDSFIGIEGYTYIGCASSKIKPGMSVNLTVSYNAYMNWSGFSSPLNGFSYWFSF